MGVPIRSRLDQGAYAINVVSFELVLYLLYYTFYDFLKEGNGAILSPGDIHSFIFHPLFEKNQRREFCQVD